MASSFVPTPSLRCMSPRSARLAALPRNSSIASCVQRCLDLPRCVAIERYVPTGSCALLSECLHRERALHYVVAHYQPPPWPFPAARMRWRTGVAVVVASYNRDITLTADLLSAFTPSADLVVYHKHDFNESRHVPMGWHRHVLGECLPNASHRSLLSYLQILPNHGTTVTSNPNSTHGGSREPFAFLQFLLDFYTMLPDVVLFTQDDTRGGGMYNLGAANRLGTALRSLLAGGDDGGDLLAKYTSAARRPDSASCLCIFNRNGRFNVTGYYWIVSGLRQSIFRTPSTSLNDPLAPEFEHTFPASARFAVGRADVLSRPPWVYEVLMRLTTAEKVWYWIGSSYLANVLERFWFVLFDAGLTPRSVNVSAIPFRTKFTCAPDESALSWAWDFPTTCEATRGAPRLGFDALVTCSQLARRGECWL